MADYSSVKGCIIMRPYAQALWENIQHTLDGMFKETGHENVAMPIFIPESLLQKEADHVEGFAPEVCLGNPRRQREAGGAPVRSSDFGDAVLRALRQHRPFLARSAEAVQPVVLAWSAGKRPPVRSCVAVEFWWQEGHTVHATAEEAMEETVRMLNIYAKFCEE